MGTQKNHWEIDANRNWIHSTALVADDIHIGHDNLIGPFSVVGGMGCPVNLGNYNYIGANCVLGSLPENTRDLPGSAMKRIQQGDVLNNVSEFQGGLAIGSMVVIRDLVTIHGGMRQSTRVDDLVYIHSRCHLDHDAVAEVGAILAPGVTTGGRVSFGAFSQTGLESSLHQDTEVGAFSMIGMNSTVKGTVLPFSLHFGSPSRFRGLNMVRLKRLGLKNSEIEEIEGLIRTGSFSRNQVRLEEIVMDLIAKSTSEAQKVWMSWLNEVPNSFDPNTKG